VFEAPLSLADARGNVDALLARPHVRTTAEDERFWGLFCTVTTEVPTRGNLVPDAHIVSLMRQSGVRTIWTHDRDFRKFDGIAVRDPFVD
jgi:hypothetical protein